MTTPDAIYTALHNAGFQVAISGMSFIVSLINRPVHTSEVETALGFPTGVRYARSGAAVVVYC